MACGVMACAVILYNPAITLSLIQSSRPAHARYPLQHALRGAQHQGCAGAAAARGARPVLRRLQCVLPPAWGGDVLGGIGVGVPLRYATLRLPTPHTRPAASSSRHPHCLPSSIPRPPQSWRRSSSRSCSCLHTPCMSQWCVRRLGVVVWREEGRRPRPCSRIRDACGHDPCDQSPTRHAPHTQTLDPLRPRHTRTMLSIAL